MLFRQVAWELSRCALIQCSPLLLARTLTFGPGFCGFLQLEPEFARYMEILRIGFIGAGGNTRLRHIPGFMKCEGVEPVVLCNRSMESSQKVAEEFGVPRVAGDWREIVQDPRVDAVCIGTWPNTHAEMTVAALEAGKHVLCEARMSASLEEAESMLEASRLHPGLVAQIVPSPLSLDLDARVTTLLGEGVVGNLLEVIVTHTFAEYQDALSPLPWRLDRRLSGVNALTLGILHEMVQRWIPGNPNVLHAVAGIHTPERLDEASGSMVKVGLPESLNIVARFPSGPRLIYHLSGIDAGPPLLDVRLNGSGGTLHVNLPQKVLTLYRPGSEQGEIVEVPCAEKRGWRVEEDFISSIRTGAPVTLTDFKTGVRYMRFSQVVDDMWRHERKKHGD